MTTTTCSFLDCGRPHHSHGLCSPHADQSRRGIELRPIRGESPKPCSFDGCDRPHYGRSVCKSHLAQLERGAPLTALRAVSRKGGQAQCSFDGCDRISNARSLCKAHYQQWSVGKELAPIRDRVAPTAGPKVRKPRADKGQPKPRAKSKMPKGWDHVTKITHKYTGADKTATRDAIGSIRPLRQDEIVAARHVVELMARVVPASTAHYLAALGLTA